jgi:hypothetical protein
VSELLEFKHKAVVPPGGYRYVDPDTKFEFAAHATLLALCVSVSKHRAANDLEVPPNLPAIVEDWICRHIPIEMTSAHKKAAIVGHRGPFSATAVRQITQTMLRQWRRAGRKTTSIQEAAKRADVCIDCVQNTQKTGCQSCNGERNWVQSFLGRKGTRDAKLYVCAVDATMNLASIHMPPGVIQGSIPLQVATRFPESCWKRKLLGDPEP